MYIVSLTFSTIALGASIYLFIQYRKKTIQIKPKVDKYEEYRNEKGLLGKKRGI